MKIKCLPFILLLFITTDLLAQQDSVTNFGPSDYIITWREGGMIAPRSNHRYVFCITDSSLSCDTAHLYGFRPDEINKMTLDVHYPQSAYNKMKGITHSIPKEMMENKVKRYGRQEVDGGQVYVIASIHGLIYKWTFTGPLYAFSPAVQKFAYYLYDKMP